MDFIANREAQNRAMLKELGIHSFLDLLDAVPKKLLLDPPQQDDGLSEFEGMKRIEALADLNTYHRLESYLGAGAYAHHIPAIVSAITSRSEFLTAYTPYQAEASQGLLQALFEYQSSITALTGMDLSNASLYDGSSACAEACLMALRGVEGGSRRIAISSALNPLYREVIDLYTEGLCEIETIPHVQGKTDWNSLHGDYAAILVQSPNFFGTLEEMPKNIKWPLIVCSNPLSYGLFKSAGELGAEIAVGDLQPLGLPLSFGGPYAGYIACKTAWMRKMPGRIVGKTVDTEGKCGYVLTLQAREQHIRREKATSNICTNQTLAAIASLVTLLWYGPEGLKKLALTNYKRAHYLASQLSEIKGWSLFSKDDFFNEFAIQLPCKSANALEVFRSENIDPGLPLNRFFPELENHLLVSVTEIKSKENLDHYLSVARRIT